MAFASLGILGLALCCAATENNVGSTLLSEDAFARVWELKLEPGESTGVHRHDYDYHFVVLSPSQLQVFAENGTSLFEFRAEGTFGFRRRGDELVPFAGSVPWVIPAVHSARNVGESVFHELVFESKVSTNATWPRPRPGLLRRALDPIVEVLRHARRLGRRARPS